MNVSLTQMWRQGIVVVQTYRIGPMRNLILCVLCILAPARLASPCSCINTGTPCSEFRGSKVAFVGRVIVDSGEGHGKGPARLIVQEAFHGLPKEVREVEIDTDFGTSCYMRLKLDEQYLILAHQVNRQVDHLKLNSCSFSFRVKGNELLLEALRQMEMGGSPSLIGKVYTMTGEYSNKEGPVGLKVIAESENNLLTTTTVQFGEFAFPNVPIGTYTLHVDSDQYVQENSRYEGNQPLKVDANDCGFGRLYVWPAGQISGRVTNHLGVAIKGTKVQAFAYKENGELDNSAIKEALTDEFGQYTLLGMPQGEFAVAVNGEEYEDRLAYPPTFFSGTYRRQDATHILLSELERKQEINIQLPPARKPAILNLLVTLSDGTPVAGVRAKLLDNYGIERFFSTKETDTQGRLSLQVYQGETYAVEVFKLKVLQNKIQQWEGKAGPVIMDITEKALRVIVAEK